MGTHGKCKNNWYGSYLSFHVHSFHYLSMSRSGKFGNKLGNEVACNEQPLNEILFVNNTL